MKRFAILIPLLLAACASHNATEIAAPVSVRIEQLDAPPNGYYYPGPVSIRFEVTVANQGDQPVTLRRVDLRTAGSGAYVMHSLNNMLNLTVQPKSTGAVSFFAWGQALGGNLHANEPVTLTMTAYFDSPKGPFLRNQNQIIQM